VNDVTTGYFPPVTDSIYSTTNAYVLVSVNVIAVYWEFVFLEPRSYVDILLQIRFPCPIADYCFVVMKLDASEYLLM